MIESGMKKIIRIVVFLVALAAGFYVVRAGDLYFRQERYVFKPEKTVKQTPGDRGLKYEELTLRSSDGVNISAWYIPAENSKGTILFCHGNARNMALDLDGYLMFHGFGYSILTLDYRGYGKSEGRPSEEGVYLDAQSAWDWLVQSKHEMAARIVICGRSLGSAIAANLAAKNPPAALILEAAFTSLPEVGQERYPYFPVKLLSRYRFDTLSQLPRVHCPVLIVHSHDDELISIRHGRRLYEAVEGRKEFVEIGGPHKGNYKPTLGHYQEGVKHFLESLTGSF